MDSLVKGKESIREQRMESLVAYIESEYGLSDFLGWLDVWHSGEEWDFPAFLMEFPKGLLKPLLEKGTFFRGMILYGEAYESTACSWSSDRAVAEEFSDRERFWSDEKGIGVVYERTCEALSVTRLIAGIEEYGSDIDQALLSTLKEWYSNEKEYIAGFSPERDREIYREER